MVYSINETLDTAATDGVRIMFGPDFLNGLTDSELDFIMMHEVLHVVLQRCLQHGDREPERFNIACDIVVNSNILLENQMDRQSITLKKYGESMHFAPDGKEGYEYTAEQVYEMLPEQRGQKKGQRHQRWRHCAGTGQAGTGTEKDSAPAKLGRPLLLGCV